MFIFDLNCSSEVADYGNLERRTVSFSNLDNDSDLYFLFVQSPAFTFSIKYIRLAFNMEKKLWNFQGW